MQRKLLFLVLILAFVLRVVWLSQFPQGFTPDEASFGYDAYCLLTTGKDQWGKTLPLVLESFGDFKPPPFSYLTIPSVLVFGLSKFSVRLTNAVFGVLSVYILYLLIRKILQLHDSKLEKKKFIDDITYEDLISLFGALLLSVSSWHMMLSRGAFEANLVTLFIPLGIFLFLESFKKPKMLVWSGFVFGLGLFSYHSARVVTPAIVFVLIVVFHKKLKKIDKGWILRALGVFGVFFILMLYTFTQGAAKRAQDISVFSGALEAQAGARLQSIESGMSPTIARLIHNKFTVASDRFIKNYSQYISPKFLLIDGPAEATYGMIPGNGVLYWFEFLSLFVFLYVLFKERKKIYFFVLLWILIAPVPAALTMGVGYSANRAATMMPAVQIAAALGFAYLLVSIDKVRLEKFLLVTLIAVSATPLIFIQKYFEPSTELSKQMLYGNMEAVTWLKDNTPADDQILVSRKLSEPHIYVAFANKWDPKDYQVNSKSWYVYREMNLKFLDQLGEYKLGNYTFASLEDDIEDVEYIVGRSGELEDAPNVIKSFLYPGGEPAIHIVRQPEQIYAYERVDQKK